MNGFIKKTLIFALVMGLLAGGAWTGRRLYKRATEKRLLADARASLEKRDFRNAGLSLQRVLQINPLSVEGTRLTADMLEAGSAPATVSWRIRASQLKTNDMSLRFEWAQSALKLGDQRSALMALSGVEQNSRKEPEFHKLMGAFAWSMNDGPGAERHYAEALRLEPTNGAIVLNLATIRLASTNTQAADQARLTLEQIPTNSTLRSTAVRYLAADAAARKALPKAIRYSAELVSVTNASTTDKLTHLTLLREAGSKDYPAWRSALEAEARTAPEKAFSWGRWLFAVEGPTNSLRWLSQLPPAMQTNSTLPLLITDCLIATKDWKTLLSTVERRDWGEANFYRLALESFAHRNLESTLPSKTAWQKSVRLASGRLDRLVRLNQLAAGWGWRPEVRDLLFDVVTKFPKEKWAANQLIDVLYAEGNTKAMSDVLTKVVSADPSDNRLKNNLASVSLLRKSNMENAHRMAREAYDSAPDNPFYISTYAYSLLLQNKPGEAVGVVEKLKADQLTNPSIAAYFGIVQAHAGHAETAREPLKLAETAALLPEEREIIKSAKAKL